MEACLQFHQRILGSWQLEGSLPDALNATSTPVAPSNGIIIGDEVCVSVSKKGWQSNECTDAISKLCTAAGLGLNKAKEVLSDSCQQAVEELTSYGFSDIAKIIPEN